MLLNAIFLKSNYDGDIDKDFGNLMRVREINYNLRFFFLNYAL